MKSIWTSIIIVAASHLAIAILIQIETLIFYVQPKSFQLFIAVLFGQSENIAFSIVIALPLIFFARFRPARILYTAIPLIGNLYLLLNQVFYQLFFDHYQLSFSEGQVDNINVLWDSFAAELSPMVAVNLVVILAVQALVMRRLYREHVFTVPGWFHYLLSKPKSTAVLTVCAVTFVVYFSYCYIQHNLIRHPVVSLFSGSIASPAIETVSIDKTSERHDLGRLRYGQTSDSTDSDNVVKKSLSTIARTIKNRERKPNLILVILESIGSLQLLPNGSFDPEVTPRLSQFSAHMVRFPAIYNTAPRTTRSHIVIQTGGQTMTSGDLFEYLKYPYTGPALVNHLKEGGYHTGLFSAADLEFERLGMFYRSLNYDKVFEPFSVSSEFRKKHKIHSWGISEEAVLPPVFEWIESLQKKQDTIADGMPFFLHYLTISAHHPYGIPKGFEKRFPGKGRYIRYRNSLYYTDFVLGRLIDELADRQLLSDTILFICGDHGQAFGRHHPKNFTHQHYLYEENIKNFLIVLDVQSVNKPLTVNRQASLADIMPTILDLSGQTAVPSAGIIGRSLFSPKYDEHLVYFHKNSHPALWGLRDGPYKFISEMSNTFRADGNHELYDLRTDPHEQKNMASQLPAQVRDYHQLCKQWYIDTGQDFVNYLDGHPGGDPTDDLTTTARKFGPQHIAFGIKPKDDFFRELDRIHPRENVLVWTYGVVPFREHKKIRFLWRSPSGKERSFLFNYRKGWTNTWVKHGAREPMEEGEWSLTLYDGDEKLISGKFIVDEKATLNIVNKHLR